MSVRTKRAARTSEATPTIARASCSMCSSCQSQPASAGVGHGSSRGGNYCGPQGFERAWLALLASLYGVARAEIEQREKKRQLRTRNYWIGGLSVVVIGFAGLTAWALWSRSEAIVQGKIAEARRKTATAAQLVAESRRNERLESLALAAEANAIKESPATKANLVELIERFWHVDNVAWDEPGTWHPLVRSPDSRWVATGTPGGKVRLWQYPGGELIGTLYTGGSAVVSLAISGDGRLVAVGDYAGALRVWRFDDRTLVSELGHESEDYAASIALNGDGSRLFAARGTSVEIWSVADQRLTNTLDNEAEINTLTVNRDARLLATGSDDNKVRLWDLKTSKRLWTLGGHGAEVEAVAFSPDSKTLASAGGDRTIRIWRLSDRPTSVSLVGSQDIVRALAFDDTGKRLVSGGREGALRVWDLDVGKEINLGMQGQNVEAAAFLLDREHVVASGTDGSVVFWDLQKNSPFASTLQRHRTGSQIFGLAVSRDGRFVASGGDDGFIRLWDMRASEAAGAEQQFHIGTAIESLAISADNRYLAAGTESGRIDILEIPQGRRIGTDSPAHTGAVHALAFHPSG
jgi:WD40 repeat protein